MGWSGAFTALVFLPMKLAGFLRVSDKEQEVGGDLAVMGTQCYPPNVQGGTQPPKEAWQ
jgi:ammonia channel protein AmtB